MTTTTQQQPTRSHTALAAHALAVVTPVAVWGLVGQQDSPGFSPHELDYMVRPLNIPLGLERALTIGSIAVLIVAAVYLIGAVVRGRAELRWLTVLGPVLAAGAALGLLERIVTAGGIGANIGGTLAMFALVPFIVAMLAIATVFSRRLRNAPHPQR